MRLKNLLLLLLLASLWGPSFLFIKIALEDFSPITLAAVRIAIAAVMLHVMLLINKYEFNRSWKFWRHVAIAGFFGQSLPFVLISWGEQYIDSSIASILNGLTPLFTVLIANFTLVDEKMTGEKIVGTVLGFIGLVVIASPGFSTGMDNSVMGVIAVSIAAISYGVGIVYSRIYLVNEKPLYAPASQLLVSSLYLIPFAYFMEGGFDLSTISFDAYGAVVILGVFGTALAFIIYYRLLSTASASYLSLVTYLMPIFGITLGIIFLDEHLTIEAIAGAAMIVLGIMIANRVFSNRTQRVKA